MPVDKAMADTILDPYRKMYREISEKGVESDSFKAMEDSHQRMEVQAMETRDVVEFTAKLTTEDLFIQFSNAYTETMTAMMKGEYSGNSGDEILLEKTLEAYENSIKNLEGVPNSELLKTLIEELIKLGRSGISYPVFLRKAEESGLNQLLEGDMVVMETIMQNKTFAKLMHLPLEVEKQERQLKIYDGMVADSPFKVADSFQFGLEREKLDWDYAPLINAWNMTIHLWDKMLMNVYEFIIR